MAEPDARAPDDLYGLPLDEFIAARDALAKELKAAGDKDAAADVKKLRKPSLAAWALNRTARRHPEDVARLLEAAAGVQQAQEDALAGDARGLREATRALADEVERVADVAAAELGGSSGGQRDRMVSSLRAATTDEVGADLLRRGVLVEHLAPAGFGLGGLGDAAPAPKASPERARGKPKASKEATEAVEAAKRELRRAESEAETAETRAHRRAERAEAAARRAVEAQREAEEARSEAEEASGVAVAARRRAADAATRLAEAEAALA